MIEKDWALPIEGRKKIYGRLVQASAKPSDRLIVFVHGLTSDMTDYPCLPSVPLFIQKNYDCLLFNLYDWQPGARKLRECTLKVHGRDIDKVLRRKTKGYKNVFLIGHSYGGPSIMKAACEGVKAVSLWDPSYNIAAWWPAWTVKKNSALFFRGAMDTALPTALNREALTLDLEGCRRLSRAFLKPIQVIHAGRGILYKYKESYDTHSRHKTDRVLIANADHSFTHAEVLQEAVNNTHRWFSSFRFASA